MSTPLSPCSADTLNRTNSSTRIFDKLFDPPTTAQSNVGQRKNDTFDGSKESSSSPFQTEVDLKDQSTRVADAASPVFSRSFQVAKKSPSEPFKIHEDIDITQPTTTDILPRSKSRQAVQNIKPIGDETLSQIREQTYRQHEAQRPLGETLQSRGQNEGTLSFQHPQDLEEHDAPSFVSDDTCFSTFSAVPNADMTLFAKLGNRTADNTIRSPLRQTPASKNFNCSSSSGNGGKHGSSRTPSPTPRGSRPARRDGDTTNLLLDFTQTLDVGVGAVRKSPAKRHGPSPTKTTEPKLLSYINKQRMPSPSKNQPATPASRRDFMTLLDFDLPPQPTPRSVPTITIRELESLKSQYLSEISSLKASLSGREAEVDSLKKAINDAEQRVGQSQERLREERSAREHAERERGEWEKKWHEIEAVLQSVREEFVFAEKERDELLEKLEESNRLRDDAETKLVEANTKAIVCTGDGNDVATGETSLSDEVISQRVNAQLDEKMENLARELHAVYKKKHESKVATLKKTYEARSEKRCNELQQQIESLQKQNEDLQSNKDASFSGAVLTEMPNPEHSSDLRRLEQQTAELEEHRARLAGLAEEMRSMRNSQEELMRDLERERVEKGELVAAVDEMLALQADVGAPTAIEDFRKSINRPPSGLRGPGFAGPKATGIPGKSKMLANIERMGSSRAQ